MKHHKLFFAIIFSFLMPFCATAQVQRGYVKTRGRLGSDGAVIPGEGIENVTVKVKNEGTVISDNSGCFEIALRNEKYYLENVTKKGYLLVDADILSKRYTRSVDTFKIVLTTPEQQLEDELASERKLRRTLTCQLQQREDEIEELYETSKIIKAERDSALRKLYADHADNEKLIKDMVERYSRIDYDQLDEFNRLISEYIFNGELLKADSLLGSKGDILSRIEEYRTHKQLNDDERAELAEREKDLAKSEELERKRLADLAGDCYSKFEIFKLQHLNDSAAYYIELRASLDSTNVEWQLETGYYIKEYLAYYDKAEQYYQCALQSALNKYGDKHPDVATIYNNIGSVYSSQGNYSQALEYYNKALEIRLVVFGEQHSNVATCYNNIGGVYDNQGNYSQALEYYNKALEIWLAVFDEQHPNVATSYNNIGDVYSSQGNYSQALEYYNKALEILLVVFGEQHPDVALSYNNIVGVYYNQSNYSQALEYYNKALEIWLVVFGEQHPDVAACYHNIGVVYSSQGNYSQALEYYNKALEILLAVFGEQHPNVATSYNSIGGVYDNQGNYSQALEYYNKALEIRLVVFGEQHPDV
ncbi:MAG: DUF2225 domain-containing protein, partial [Bacteroidaceae bacterium]|nr:DUF2225 domain-containing protein [Bacteroidaceae bacterium]